MASFKFRVIALCAAGTIAFGGTSLAAPLAYAQSQDGQSGAAASTDRPAGAPAPEDPVDAEDAGRIVNQRVTLNIHKKLGDPQSEVKPGEQPNPSLPGLEEVVYKIERISDLDLTTQAGWKRFNDLAASQEELEKASATLEAVVYTDENGLATFTKEDGVGVYRITELRKEGYSTGKPFLVSLPYQENNVWKYTRNVYPKNQELKPNKQIDANSSTIGDFVDFTINAPVPAGQLDKLTITDSLIQELSIAQDTAGVQVTATAGGAAVELAAADYLVNIDAGNRRLTVDFTETGLQKLAAARENSADVQVHVKFSAMIDSISENGITNTAQVEYPNGMVIDTDGTDEGGERKPTQAQFGTLTITKTTPDDGEAADLTGARFDVYRCTPAADGNAAPTLVGNPLPVSTHSAADAEGHQVLDFVEITDQEQGTYSATGTGYGVPISTYAAGGTGTVNIDICVVETVAPEGFVRNPEIHQAEINREAKTLSVSVENQRSNFLSSLPATGAWGIILVFLVGLGLLARGFYTSRKDGRATA